VRSDLGYAGDPDLPMTGKPQAGARRLPTGDECRADEALHALAQQGLALYVWEETYGSR